MHLSPGPVRASSLSLFLLVLVSIILQGALSSASAIKDPVPAWLNRSLATEERLQSFLSNLTFEEKISLVQGNKSAETNACIGYTRSPHPFLPDICMGDGPSGVGNNLANVTTFPAPILTASSWSRSLSHRFGNALGAEHKSKGRNVILAPTINIVRSPAWGRAGESLFEDPFLTSEIGVGITQGIQSNEVVACPKHFAAYNQEIDRFGLAPGFEAVDAVVGERVLREVYFPAFKSVVQDGEAGCVMCAYNKVNGEHACESPWLLNEVLKREWAFDGFVVTDWYFAQRSAVRAANAGLDNSQPGGDWIPEYGFPDFFGGLLDEAVGNGSVSEERVHDMVARLWRPMFSTGAVDSPSTGLEGEDVFARTKAHLNLAQEIVEEGSILLKNDGVLPLGKEKVIAAFGADANDEAAVTELHGGFVLDSTMVVQKPLDSIRHRAGENNISVLYSEAYPGTNTFPTIPSSMFGSGLNVSYWTSTDFSGPVNCTIHAYSITASTYPSGIGAIWPDVFSSRYTGFFYPNVTGRYHFSISGNGGANLYLNDTLIASVPGSNFDIVVQGFADLEAGTVVPLQLDYSMGYSVDTGAYGVTLGVDIAGPGRYEHAIKTAEAADVSIVFVNDAHTEGADSALGLRLPGDQDEMISLVAKHSKRTVVVLNTNSAILMPWIDEVDAVIESFYPGQQVGLAMARLFFGVVNFSGKLSVTFPRTLEEMSTASEDRFPGVNLTAKYSEGLYVGYKWFDDAGVEPLFPFGHGLSYSTFEIEGLTINAGNTTGVIQITPSVRNAGPMAGKEVMQLYVRFPEAADEPPKLLKGSEKVALDVKESITVTFNLTRGDISIWSTEQGAWVFVPGKYGFLVGRSSRDIVQEATVNLS